MRIHFKYNPIYNYNINAELLVFNVIIGLLLVMVIGQVGLLLLLAILSQFLQIKILLLKLFYPTQIKGLDNVITSAKLFDKPDE